MNANHRVQFLAHSRYTITSTVIIKHLFTFQVCKYWLPDPLKFFYINVKQYSFAGSAVLNLWSDLQAFFFFLMGSTFAISQVNFLEKQFNIAGNNW